VNRVPTRSEPEGDTRTEFIFPGIYSQTSMMSIHGVMSVADSCLVSPVEAGKDCASIAGFGPLKMLDEVVNLGLAFRNCPIVDPAFPEIRDDFDKMLEDVCREIKKNRAVSKNYDGDDRDQT
jgi:hypothetical protein